MLKIFDHLLSNILTTLIFNYWLSYILFGIFVICHKIGGYFKQYPIITNHCLWFGLKADYKCSLILLSEYIFITNNIIISTVLIVIKNTVRNYINFFL